VRGSVKDVRQSFDPNDVAHPSGTCFFLSSSVPDPGHRIVRFADVLRDEVCGEFCLWNRRTQGCRGAARFRSDLVLT
jgi:hypothetical protein